MSLCVEPLSLNDDGAIENKSDKNESESESISERLSVWSGYFRKTLPERQEQIRIMKPNLPIDALNTGSLPTDTANIMIENCIGVLALPMGVAPNFIVNGKHFIVELYYITYTCMNE